VRVFLVFGGHKTGRFTRHVKRYRRRLALKPLMMLIVVVRRRPCVLRVPAVRPRPARTLLSLLLLISVRVVSFFCKSHTRLLNRRAGREKQSRPETIGVNPKISCYKIVKNKTTINYKSYFHASKILSLSFLFFIFCRLPVLTRRDLNGTRSPPHR